LNHWDLFGSVGAHSLALFWADTPYLAAWIDAIPAGTLPRFYLDTGRSDPHLLSTQEFEQLLSDKDVPHTWRLFTGYHDEAYWSAHVEGYMRFYAEGWVLESRE
jgi:enterochelin esterase-like enzyme